MDLSVEPCGALDAHIGMPGDKAVSHRAAILLALSRKGGRLVGFSSARDAQATLEGLRAMGAGIHPEGGALRFEGGGLRPPAVPIDCGESASTMRMLAGVAAGCPWETVFTGAEALLRRPMDRVAEPLRAMGAEVSLSPLRVKGGRLKGIAWASPVASAQVKTAVLIAGLRAEGETTVTEPFPSRDHTERLLRFLGPSLEGGVAIEVPGDPSSAAFFIVGAALREGSKAFIHRVGVNPTRLGFVRALERMGAKVSVKQTHEFAGEPVGEIHAEGGGRLKGIRIGAAEIPSLIDELPILALAATQAEGETVVEGAAELRLKESDRIEALVAGLSAMGAKVSALPDGFRVVGPTPLKGAGVDAFGDHRIAMTLAIAGKLASGRTVIHGFECVEKSFPEFEGILEMAS